MNKKNILFLTWKDIKHPNKWGAETVIYEYAKWLVKKWYNVTWFWYAYKWCLEQENIDWINIIRKFSTYTSFYLFPKYYRDNLSWKYDIIIDEAWWLPFLSPNFEKKIPIILFTHHIWDREWDYAFPFPLNKIWKQLYYFLFILYKNYKTITVSNSTKNDLINKFSYNWNNIKVIENALNLDIKEKIDFEKKENSILFIWRLMPIKRVEDAIKAFSLFSKKNTDYKLNIVWVNQDKKYTAGLIRLIERLLLKEKVNFVWYDNNILEKYLNISKVLLVPSYKEGFWLIVLEWNAYWLPVIWYDVAWLRDSIKPWLNWFLVDDWEYNAMWDRLSKILKNDDSYKDLANKSLEHVKSLEWWEEKVDQFEKFIFENNKYD
jgi:glycosyltransferase involved in cell wall biosynthesis